MARPRKGNVALNLSVDEDLKRLFDAQCALEGVEMSEVTEQLYRERPELLMLLALKSSFPR